MNQNQNPTPADLAGMNLNDITENFLIKLLSNTPIKALVEAIKTKTNLIVQFEPFILAKLDGPTIDKLLDIQEMGLDKIFEELEAITEKTDLIQFQVLNTKEGREFIELHFNEISRLI